MNHQLYQFKPNVDLALLLQEALDDTGYDSYFDPISKTSLRKWKIKHIDSGYALKVSKYWSEFLGSGVCKPRFYNLAPDYTLPFHTDRGTLCSLNYVLSGKSGGVTFGDGIISYECALLNTQLMHSVPAQGMNRILFKVSIFDLSYDTVKSKLETPNIEYILP